MNFWWGGLSIFAVFKQGDLEDWCWLSCPFPKSLAILLTPPVNPYSLLLQGTAVGWRSGVCFPAGSSDTACGQQEGCWGGVQVRADQNSIVSELGNVAEERHKVCPAAVPSACPDLKDIPLQAGQGLLMGIRD